MPVQHGIVGPIPEGREPEEYDKLRRRVLWKMPSGLFAIGSRAGDRRNMMTANWVSQVSFDPKLVAVSVEKAALTHELIEQGHAFSVNVVDREERAVVRKFTKPVIVDEQAQTFNEIPFRDGSTGVPVLRDAVAFVECEVRQEVDCGDHTLFVGEVVEAGFQKPEETEVLRMGDTRMNYGG